jgi:hypothetical protein
MWGIAPAVVTRQGLSLNPYEVISLNGLVSAAVPRLV